MFPILLDDRPRNVVQVAGEIAEFGESVLGHRRIIGSFDLAADPTTLKLGTRTPKRFRAPCWTEADTPFPFPSIPM